MHMSHNLANYQLTTMNTQHSAFEGHPRSSARVAFERYTFCAWITPRR